MNKQDIEQTIANVEQQLASLKAELLKQATPEPPNKWERTGDWILWASGGIEKIHVVNDGLASAVNQGRTYQTKGAAESVKPYDAFYGLLCGLACELNPSGKVGGYWFVYWAKNRAGWVHDCVEGVCTIDQFFETTGAAEQAAQILNRDGIKPPQVGGSK